MPIRDCPHCDRKGFKNLQEHITKTHFPLVKDGFHIRLYLTSNNPFVSVYYHRKFIGDSDVCGEIIESGKLIAIQFCVGKNTKKNPAYHIQINMEGEPIFTSLNTTWASVGCDSDDFLGRSEIARSPLYYTLEVFR